METISIMRFGQLLAETTRGERRAIIKDIIDTQKAYPPFYMKATNILTKGVREYFDQDKRKEYFFDEIDNLRVNIDSLDDNARKKIEANIRAIEIFAASEFVCKANEFLCATEPYKREYENFAISFTPNLVFRTKKGLGLVKFRINQNEARQKYIKVITSFMVLYLEEFFKGQEIDHENCILYDILNVKKQMYNATKSNDKPLKDLDEICNLEVVGQIKELQKNIVPN